MTFNGRVTNGLIVLEGNPALPEGAPVKVEVLPEAAAQTPSETLGHKLLKHAGKAVGLPADASRNHDHYLYGTPKR